MKDWHQPPLALRIPMCCQRCGGRRRIVAPDGSEIAPATKPQAVGTLVKVLARLGGGSSCSTRCVQLGHRDLRSGGIGKSYVSRILRLALLAPDIIEAILGGGADQSLMLERLERPLPASWEEQRDNLCV
jgi:hypothetical protein